MTLPFPWDYVTLAAVPAFFAGALSALALLRLARAGRSPSRPSPSPAASGSPGPAGRAALGQAATPAPKGGAE